MKAVRSSSIPERVNNSQALMEDLHSDSVFARVRAVSQALGVTIVLKGTEDILTSGGDVYVIEQMRGSPRRCGGQGDLLAGSLAVTVHWARRMQEKTADSSHCPSQDHSAKASPSTAQSNLAPMIRAGMLATATIRKASELAFAEAGRSMTSVDVLAKVGRAFQVVSGEST